MSVADDHVRTHGQPLNHDAALELDEQIQVVAGKTGEHLDYLSALLLEAKAGEIHKSLGFPSWTAYSIERLRPIAVALNVQDRRTLVAQLHRHGLSVRAVAEAVGMSKSSVGRQVSQCGTGGEAAQSAETTTGTDGKDYPRRRNGGPRGPLPAEMALKRYRSAIRNLDGLPEEAESLKDRICEEIDELISLVNGELVNLDG
ncbi:helix-turn-helix domain-containing protein [Mycolicibacterium houstonense]|uniref:helix-turn-helix domain-containing protein n=1 Tax=Mycolicibacterium houstonense TaxID=146021 RepID=UPI000832315F|nr:helix-turn-helix domain-containing protein [Mycolicibacterium houstonense]